MQTLSRLIGATIWLGMCSPSFCRNDAGAPLPPVASVIQQAVARAQLQAENDRAFKQRYFYTRTRVKEVRDGNGILKQREHKQIVNDPPRQPPRPALSPPASQPNARASSPKEQASPASTPNRRGRAFEKQDFLLNPDLLNRFDFTLTGRRSVNGRDTLVVDFKPKAGELPERNLKERFINRAAGRVWLDEAESQLVRAKLYLTEKVDVLGGLVGSVWKFTCALERERTEDGLWFTRTTSWHLEGREVWVRRIIDYHEQTTDLRRAR